MMFFCLCAFSDEGVDNESGEACQTAGTGPHWRQGEVQQMLANCIRKKDFPLLAIFLDYDLY